MNSNLISRLKAYQEDNKLSIETLRDQLRASGVMVSSGSVRNWIKNNNAPSQMFWAGIENFLMIGGKSER